MEPSLWGNTPHQKDLTPQNEAKTLWIESQSALTHNDLENAIYFLKQFVSRYPGQPDFLKAQILLGSALRKSGKTEESIPYFTDYIRNTQINPDSIQARLELSQAYLDTKKFSEAHLAVLEAEKALQTRPNLELRIPVLFMKAQSWIALDRDFQAFQLIESLEKQFMQGSDLKMKGKGYNLKITAKTHLCAQLNLKGNLNESQIHNQIERRGLCLLEALLIFQKTLQIGHHPFIDSTTIELEKAFSDYHQACSHPPAPKSRTRQAQNQFQKELADWLIPECQKKSSTALELLDSWKPQFPNATQSAALRLSQLLTQLISRSP